MQAYLDIVKNVLENGERRSNRTGMDTFSVFNVNYSIDLANGFPLLTSKKISWKNIVLENLWFLSGKEHIQFLWKHGAHFWNPWADDNGYVPSPYGHFWRDFFGVDQVGYVVKELRENPNSRRLVVSAWEPCNAIPSKLPPCHLMFIFNTNGGRLNLHLTQRSCDIAIGLPYNIAGYALILSLIARFTGFEPGIFAHSIVDAHIYENHVEGLKEQLQREPVPLPSLWLGESVQGLSDVTYLGGKSTDEIMSLFLLEGYDPYPAIKFDVAV